MEKAPQSPAIDTKPTGMKMAAFGGRAQSWAPGSGKGAARLGTRCPISRSCPGQRGNSRYPSAFLDGAREAREDLLDRAGALKAQGWYRSCTSAAPASIFASAVARFLDAAAADQRQCALAAQESARQQCGSRLEQRPAGKAAGSRSRGGTERRRAGDRRVGDDQAVDPARERDRDRCRRARSVEIGRDLDSSGGAVRRRVARRRSTRATSSSSASRRCRSRKPGRVGRGDIDRQIVGERRRRFSRPST